MKMKSVLAITAYAILAANAPFGTPVIPSAQAEARAPSCSNGTYVNSQGHIVCRPLKANRPPSGATARCSDGTYSFSQSHRGTCSHHGGVASWL